MTSSLLLLLGLVTPTGLHALLADGATLTDLGPVLVIPGRTGWTRVERVTTVVGSERSTFFLAAPAGQPVRTGWPANLGGCESDTTTSPTFVSEALVSTTTTSNGDCGGAHPWAGISHANDPLSRFAPTPVENDLRLPGSPLPRDPSMTWLGPDGVSKLVVEARASIAGKPSEEVDCFAESASNPAWSILHRDGRWRVEGAIHYGFEACRGMEWTFPTTLPVPSKLHLLEGAEIPRPQDAVDWITAPGADWRVEVRAREVVLVAGTQEVARLSVAEATLVQADWALGEANATRWRTEAATAAAIPGMGGSPLRFATTWPDGRLASWEAGIRGLRFVGEGVEVGDLTVDVANALLAYRVEMGEGPADQALVITKDGTPPVEPFPPTQKPPSKGHFVSVLAVTDTGVDLSVEPGGLRRIPLAPAVISGAALEKAGKTLTAQPAPRTTAASADGRVVATCVDRSLDLTVDGVLVGRTWVPFDPGPGEEDGPSSCRIVWAR